MNASLTAWAKHIARLTMIVLMVVCWPLALALAVVRLLIGKPNVEAS
jgi:hypothetical protein